MSTKLSERAMLVSLNIRRWQGTLTDKRVTEDVATKHNVTVRRAGVYRKHAIDVEAPSFKALRAAAGAMRDKFYWHTLPWGQDGSRILTAQNFERFSVDMRHLREEFEARVRDFVKDYPQLVLSAQTELNGLFNQSDYPINIKAKFGVDLTIMPLPESGDFRAALSDDDVETIKRGIEEELQRTTALAMREPYERLNAHITRMVERLSDPKGIFHDTLVTGLREICDILPALNLTGDAHLDALRVKAEQLVAGVDAQMLRDMPTMRSRIAKQAAEIQDAMAAFMGAPSHE